MKRNALNKRNLIALVLVCLVLRLLSLDLYPLMDTTEARYALMAKIMLETNNWVTPMFDYGVPFWGKPPLFTWASSFGMMLFGDSEFGARVIHWLAGGVTILLVFLFAKKQFSGSENGWLAAAILASTTPFLLFIGAVMTDTLLTLSMTGAMLCFWTSIQNKHATHYHFFNIGFFVFLGMGLLAKGPVLFVLIGIAIVTWLLFTVLFFSDDSAAHHIKRLWLSFPWLMGTCLTLAIALPWYILAEHRTPGFLNYFLIGEHIKRFVVSGWHGDMYGTAHKHIRGTIWLYGFIAMLPWSPILIWKLFQSRKRPILVKDHQSPNARHTDSASSFTQEYDLTSYLVCWLLAPMILFTFAGNILMTYIMPAIPACALLITHQLRSKPISPKWFYLGWVSPTLLIAIVIALQTSGVTSVSDQRLIEAWQNQPEASQHSLVFVDKRSFSGEYYGGREVQYIERSLFQKRESNPLTSKLRSTLFDNGFFLVDRNKNTEIADQLGCIKRYSNTSKSLYFCPSMKQKQP